MKYTVIDHTADTGIEIEAESLEELFQMAGEAFCDLICDRNTIEPKIERKISAGARRVVPLQKHGDLAELLHAFLNELLFLFDSEHLLFSDLNVKLSPSPSRGEGQGEGGVRLSTILKGEKINPQRHKIKMGIKAITWHQLKVCQEKKTWKARVIFDV